LTFHYSSHIIIHMDKIVRAIAANAQVRAFAVSTKEMVEYARAAHNTSPVVTAALGRLMTGAVMMGSMLKSEEDMLTLQINGDGPVGGLVVTADGHGHVKGYAKNPSAMMPPNSVGKLDVGGVIGNGTLTVIKDMGLKDPYSSQTKLVTGEIGDDLTAYFMESEQTPSVVALGVLMNKDNTVRQAGGFIIQLLPFATDEVIDALEERMSIISSVTAMFEQGWGPREILDFVLGDMNLEITDESEISFKCNCSRNRVERVLISMGKKQLEELVEEGEPVELNCQFCNTGYKFSPQEIKEIIASL